MACTLARLRRLVQGQWSRPVGFPGDPGGCPALAACRLSGRRATTVVPATRVAAEASLASFNPLYHFAGMHEIWPRRSSFLSASTDERRGSRSRAEWRLLARCCGGVGPIDSRVVLLLRVTERSQVRADPLRAWLPAVEPGADHADRGHPPGRYLTRELLSSLRLQRTIARSAGCSRSGRRTRRHLARADDHHEQLVRADQRDRRPRSDNRTRRPMAKAVRNVGRERRRDAQAQEPPCQRWNRHLPPRRVEHHHRAGVDQPVHRHRLPPPRSSTE